LPEVVLQNLGRMAGEHLPPGYRTPLTLRYRLPGPDEDPEEADTEIRFKLYFPAKAMASGPGAVSALARTVAGAYLAILNSPALEPFLAEED
jgi:hypothetical protein